MPVLRLCAFVASGFDTAEPWRRSSSLGARTVCEVDDCKIRTSNCGICIFLMQNLQSETSPSPQGPLRFLSARPNRGASDVATRGMIHALSLGMTLKQIEARQMKENVPFELAKKIRVLLDEARKAYGAAEWDDDGMEEKIVELVTEE